MSQAPVLDDDGDHRRWQYEMLLLEQVVIAIRLHGSKVALDRLAAAPPLSLVPPRQSPEEREVAAGPEYQAP